MQWEHRVQLCCSPEHPCFARVAKRHEKNEFRCVALMGDNNVEVGASWRKVDCCVLTALPLLTLAHRRVLFSLCGICFGLFTTILQTKKKNTRPHYLSSTTEVRVTAFTQHKHGKKHEMVTIEYCEESHKKGSLHKTPRAEQLHVYIQPSAHWRTNQRKVSDKHTHSACRATLDYTPFFLSVWRVLRLPR